MLNLFLKAKLLVFIFCVFNYSLVSSQVSINYAEVRGPIDTSGSNFYITGKRISNLGTADGDAGIRLINCHNVVISNCIIGPTVVDGIYLQSCTNITIQNCIFLDNGTAVRTWSSSGIKVNNNQFLNVKNPPKINCVTVGYGAFIQFFNSSGIGNEIKDNVGENIFAQSNPEDLINIGNSSFPDNSPLIISGNRFRGGGPSTTGGGINVGDDFDSNLQDSKNIVVINNKLVNTGQYGIAVAGGTNIRIEENQVYGSHAIYTNVGIAANKFYSSGGICSNITIRNNQVNYTGNTTPPNCQANPISSNTPSYNPFWTNNCGITSSVWNENDFFASISTTILPERLLYPFPLVYLKLDENLNDYSGTNLNATAYGNASLVCDSYRKAVSFNGVSSDIMTIPRSHWLKPSSQTITVSVWVKPNTLNNTQGFIRSQDANGWTNGWRGVLDQSYFAPWVVTDNGGVGVYCDGILNGAWNHLVFTYDGTQLKGYVNGVLKSSAILSGTITYGSTSNLAIGGSEGTYNFDGKIAEVAVYNGIKTENEISSEYNNLIGIFNGTATHSNIEATYFANDQSKILNTTDGVLANSNGLIIANSPEATSYQWQLISGSPNYTYFHGTDAYISLPNGSATTLRITTTGNCSISGVKDFTLYANYYEPFSIKLIPGLNNITINKLTEETSNPRLNSQRIKIFNTIKRLGKKESYSFRIINLLGEIKRIGILEDGKKTINISSLPLGVYIIQIMNKNNTVYVEKVYKY